MFSWARVINTHLLTGSERGCHDFAGAVNDSRSRAKRETYRALLALDDYRLTEAHMYLTVPAS